MHRLTVRRTMPAVLLLALVAADGCGAGGRAAAGADDIGRAWLSRGSTALDDLSKSGGVKVGTEFKVSDGALRTEMDGTLRAAPAEKKVAQMSPEVRAEVDAMVAKIRFQNEVNLAIAVAGARSAWIPTRADEVLNGLNLIDDAKMYMREHTADILLEASCDVAWSNMFPSEQDAARNVVGNGEASTTYGNLIDDIAVPLSEAYIDAIAKAGRVWYFKRYVNSETVEWAAYGQDIVEKAKDLTFDRNEIISGPNSAQVTHALIYYYKICMKPPGT
jgi:hypothetical protein